MASDISLRQGELLPHMEFTGQSESFLDRLAQEPALRFQVRDALGTFNIEPARNLDLGYTQRPYARIPDLFACLGVDASSYNQGQLQLVTEAFMQGCFELRDDFGRYVNQKQFAEPQLATFSQLPSELQFLAAFKVIERADTTYLLANEDGRVQLEAYLKERLGLSVPVAEDVIKAASIIESPSIIGDSLAYPAEQYKKGGHSIEATKVTLNLLVGPEGPKYGKHLGADLMAGVSIALGSKFRNIYDEPKYLAGKEFSNPESFREWAEALESFWPEVNRITDSALRLTNKTESEYPMWRSYLFMNTVYGRVFAKPVVEGFDGGLDQLVAWTEPVPDNEYPRRLNEARTWIEALRIDGNLDKRGVDLAYHAFAISLIEQLERRIILGGKSETKGRVSAGANLIDDMSASSPDLVQHLIEFSPTLGPFLQREGERRANPWGYRYTE